MGVCCVMCIDCYLKFVLVIEVIGGERSKLLRHEEAVVDVLGRHEVFCSFHARVQVLNLINNKQTHNVKQHVQLILQYSRIATAFRLFT